MLPNIIFNQQFWYFKIKSWVDVSRNQKETEIICRIKNGAQSPSASSDEWLSSTDRIWYCKIVKFILKSVQSKILLRIVVNLCIPQGKSPDIVH